MKVAFGDCVFDAEARVVTRAGRSVELSPKAFALLGALIEARPRALSKAQIHDLLWPRTYVSDASLAQVVSEVRRALGDDPRKYRWIRTIHRFGYAFSGEALELQPATPLPPANCSLYAGERELRLHEGENLVGRATDCVVRLATGHASRHHARLVVTGETVTLEDLGSKNGTFLNDMRVEGPVTLEHGDRILIGRERFVLCGGPPSGTTRSLSAPSRPNDPGTARRRGPS